MTHSIGRRLTKAMQLIDQQEACWMWTGLQNGTGYGKYGGQVAHRIVYELLVGPIAPGLELDHLCRVPLCVNPDHLEPVTRLENRRRRRDAQTHCKWGHEFTPENTRMHKGARTCRACEARRTREYKLRALVTP